jgi:uncharacterized repeat protein (TIGR03803 family)
MKTNRVSALVVMFVTLAAISAHAQTVLYSFGSAGANDLINPDGPGIIAQGRDGTLYSTTSLGGTAHGGGIFQVTPAGGVSDVWNFGGQFQGKEPISGLTLGSDGYLYGTDQSDEIGSGYGTIFKFNPVGNTIKTLHVFAGTDGQDPTAPPIQGTDGNFYGTTSEGGTYGFGTVYKITPAGVFTSLFSFGGSSGPYNGNSPVFPLVQGIDNNFYGVTTLGGDQNWGVAYKISPQGVLTVLHSFADIDGDGTQPYCTLMLANDGNFYGTTGTGGPLNGGTIFQITPQGKYNVLQYFDYNYYASPAGGLVQASDGNFYGVVSRNPSGALGGAFYSMSPQPGGKFLFNWITAAEGGVVQPMVALMQHTSGVLYGDSAYGGTANQGSFYEMDLGLKPYAALLTIMGKPGKTIQILGQGFKHATRVNFAGVQAKFTVSSDTLLTAAVPVGATTGPVTVVIPTAKNLVSRQIFRITPTLQSFTPASGSATTAVTINGAGLKQTRQVSFNGVITTSFRVNSDSQIVADVPAGAKTGKIAVTTLGGSAVSTTVFTVVH